ncbi:MAG: hypothetical protein ACKVY0_04145 [Prosthecobacter sp.]|uniref:hypothetical protein n=1 Tax=Prosthecobacter sp. TaxID=1965333 RepID=UPI0039034C17
MCVHVSVELRADLRPCTSCPPSSCASASDHERPHLSKVRKPAKYKASWAKKDIKTYADSLLALLEDNNAPVADGGDTAEQKAAKAALRARFLQHEIASDFVTDLRSDRDAIDQINQHNTTEVQEGTEDTETISVQLAAISKEMDILDPIIGNKYATNPEKLHAWERASRVERDPKRGKKDGGNGDTPTPPATPK